MLQKSSLFKTAEIFFVNPTKTNYLMEISRDTKVAHTSIKKNLDKLVKLRLINKSVEIRGKRSFPYYKANRDDKLFKEYKKIYNLTSVLESGLIDFLEDKLMPKSIVLFGSFQRGEDIEDSDIDIFVECEEEKLNLKKFEAKLHRIIQLHFRKSFGLFPKELKNNIINGIVLRGFLEGYK